jgi:hypothetical protein
VICSWTEIREHVGFFHLNLLWILAGILGVFLALDLFLFYFFWELMLVPMYFLINLWGHENRVYASLKFFVFTQTGGLLMLLSIIALYFVHGRETGNYTFDYNLLLGTPPSGAAASGSTGFSSPSSSNFRPFRFTGFRMLTRGVNSRSHRGIPAQDRPTGFCGLSCRSSRCRRVDHQPMLILSVIGIVTARCLLSGRS